MEVKTFLKSPRAILDIETGDEEIVAVHSSNLEAIVSDLHAGEDNVTYLKDVIENLWTAIDTAVLETQPANAMKWIHAAREKFVAEVEDILAP